MNRNKKILLFSCIFLIISIFFVELFSYYTNTFDYTKNKVQNKIFSFETKSDVFAEQFFEYRDISIFSSLNDNDFNNQATILLYEDSALIYWSNNISNYPIFFSPQLENQIFETNNSINFCKSYNKDNINLVSLLPLKNTYSIENQYVNNNINSYFNLSNNYDFFFKNHSSQQNQIFDSKNNFLFSIDYKTSTTKSFVFSELSSVLLIVLICIILCYFLFFSSLINKISNIYRKFSFALILTIILRLFFKLIISIPIFSSNVFSKKIFDSGFLLDSPGDMFISAFYFFIIVSFFFYLFKNKFLQVKKSASFIFYLISISIICICFFAIYRFLNINNNGLLLFNFTDVNLYSILIFVAILLIACTIVIISNNLILFALKRNNDKTLSPLYLSIVAVVAIVLTIFFNESNNRKEEINAKLIAKDNIFVRNPLVEQTFSWIFNEFGKDSTINNLFINNLIQNESSIYLNNKIYDNFNHGYLSKYYVKYIIADSSTLIRIDNDTTIYNCNEYFNSFINTFGLETEDQNLWYINDLHDVPYYIYNLKTKNYYIWFDIIPKYNLEGIGYSELLSTPESQLYSINLSKYSFAIYINNNLVRNIGKYPYENHFVKEDKIKNGKIFFIEKAYKHFVFTNNEDGTIIISNSYNILTNIISPFSLIFICLIIVHIFSRIFLVFFSGKQFINTPSLKQKIQNSSIIFFVIISLIIGIFSVFLVISLNNNKNKDVLIEKTHSLCKEIELIVNNYEKTSDIDFNEILMNLASIHFLDINIYDDNGFLIGTSNEEMFANNISSTLINIDAFEHLIDNNRYLHNEKIGTYGFLSSYMVFMHNSGEIYILNLPYFTKQVEIKNEITNYIVSFVNLYLIIIIVAIFMTYLLSKFITRPLAMLKEKLSGLSLQKTNEKIDYTQDDEIGKLIEVYNLKVDELEKSANLLAKSERESAWREMAQQVAHEIKNPLTPMKLSTQHLYKIWKENPENFDSQFEKYKETMVSQIDSLSEIATAFSNFAKMPEAKNEKINICNTINFVISFYKQTNTDISLFCESDSIFIIADQNLMMRVFHNLIRNSIQAFKKTNKKDILQISFNITVDNSNVIIKIIDNGPGISPEMKDKIFVPYFTTKSGGAGLGLAIVKNIIENAGGTITNPKTEAGAMFEIILPIC